MGAGVGLFARRSGCSGVTGCSRWALLTAWSGCSLLATRPRRAGGADGTHRAHRAHRARFSPFPGRPWRPRRPLQLANAHVRNGSPDALVLVGHVPLHLWLSWARLTLLLRRVRFDDLHGVVPTDERNVSTCHSHDE